jgi:hypothetical protein
MKGKRKASQLENWEDYEGTASSIPLLCRSTDLDGHRLWLKAYGNLLDPIGEGYLRGLDAAIRIENVLA